MINKKIVLFMTTDCHMNCQENFIIKMLFLELCICLIMYAVSIEHEKNIITAKIALTVC